MSARVPVWILALVVGGLAALGQAPWGLTGLGLMGFGGGLFVVARAARPGRIAWLFGAAYFGVALHWITEPFFVEPEVTGWLAPVALVGLAGGLALFWAAAGWAAARFWGRSIWALVLALAAAEYVRGYLFTGFPWAQPGHIWTETVGLHVAAYGGSFGLTLLTLTVAALGVGSALRPSRRGRVLLLALLGLALMPPRSAPPAQGPLEPVIRLVQPNAPQHLKWRPDMVALFFNRGLQASAAAVAEGPSPALILWPETSLPQLLERSAEARAAIAQAAGGAQVLIGAQRFDAGGNPRNLAALLASDGAITATYDKHHLVPFGEYLPLPGLFGALGIGPLASNLAGTYVPGDGPALIQIPGIGSVLVMICYEAIFPQYIRQVARPRALIHLTNDAWFGGFAGPRQHLALARLRAAEQGLPVLRAANTGISAVIDGRGRVLSALELDVTGHLDAPLPPALAPTFYAQFGDLPPLSLWFLGIFALYWRRRSVLH